MALLDRLLPAWRHSDPEVRATAVRELEKDAQEVLASVAQRDDDVRVRRIAVKKLDDPELLLEIGRTDPDEGLRSLAAARAEDLLAEHAASQRQPEECTRALARLTRSDHRVMIAIRAFHASVRRAALLTVSDDKALAEIARRATDPAIRLEALNRISSVALLHRIAVAETPPEVALAGLERIADPDQLRAIADDPRVQKVVRKRARAMLGLLELSDDHPIRVAERRERQLRLCHAVERLTGAPDAAALATLHNAQKDWEDLAARAAPDAEVETRFRRACAVVVDEIARAEQRRAAEQQRDAMRQQARVTRQQLCEVVESLEGPETPRGLEAARTAWLALGPAEDALDHELATRFAHAVERCERRHERWLVRAAFRSQLEVLVNEAEQLVQSGDPRAAVRPRAALEERWAQLASSPAGTKWLADERVLQRRFVAAGEALREQEQALRTQSARRRREAHSQVTALCAHLEQLVRAETIRGTVAQRALDVAADAAQHLGPLPAAERAALQDRLAAAQQALARRIEEQSVKEDWKRWANADVQQALIERAERLLAGDPGQIVRELGRLEQDWKRFGAAPSDQSQALWKRFRTARDELRRRGDAYLSGNQTKKEALCVAVERLADSTQWNATAEAIRLMQAEWKQIGPVRQQVSAALWERFRAPAARFFERRKAYLLARKQRREEIVGQKRALCEAVEGLADSTDWEVTAAEIKRLQTEWKRIPLSADKQPDALWERFRGACDRFFDRYGRRGQLELEARLEQAERILADLDSLRVSTGTPDAPPPERIAQQLSDALSEWSRVGSIPPEKAKRLNERLQAVCDAIEAACPDALRGHALDSEASVKPRQKLCVRLERLVTSLAANAAAPAASDLAERLKLALAANTIGGAATPPLDQAMHAAVEEAERLRAKWERLGPVVGDRARACAARFEKACADFLELRQRRPGQSRR